VESFLGVEFPPGQSGRLELVSSDPAEVAGEPLTVEAAPFDAGRLPEGIGGARQPAGPAGIPVQGRQHGCLLEPEGEKLLISHALGNGERVADELARTMVAPLERHGREIVGRDARSPLVPVRAVEGDGLLEARLRLVEIALLERDHAEVRKRAGCPSLVAKLAAQRDALLQERPG
jgi:hypothetical protein